MPALSSHAKGLIITALGVLIISPDGLLTRLIHVDHWTLIFWRALLLAFGMALIANLITPFTQEFRVIMKLSNDYRLLLVFYILNDILGCPETQDPVNA